METPKTTVGRIFAYTFIPSFMFVPWRFEDVKITSKRLSDGKYCLKIYTSLGRTSVRVSEKEYDEHHVHSRIQVKIRASRHNPEQIRAKLA